MLASGILRRSSTSPLSSTSLKRLSSLLLWSSFANCAFWSGGTMSFHTERDSSYGSDTIRVSPRREADQSGLVIISHGLGDTAEGFADVAEHLASQLPHLKFILPTAPTQPVTMNMGMSMPSWYDIVGLDERSNENCKGIEQSRQRIAKILQDEHQATGLAYNRMVLCGFSQGAALSLYTGLQLPDASQKLAGIVALSGYLPVAKTFTVTPGLEDTPILHLHGRQDPLVSYAVAEKSRATVIEKGATNYELKSYPIQHTVTMEEISVWQAFLAKVVPPDDTCKVKVKEASEMSIKELKAAIQKAGLGRQAVGLMEKSEFVKLLEDHRNGGKSA